MSKFKVGDKVIRTSEKDFGGVVKGGVYEVSEVSYGISATGINLVGHNYGEGYDYDSNSFELYVDEHCKFEIGDSVKLKSGLSCINLNHIDTYTIAKVYANAVALVGFDYAYSENVFMPAEKIKKVFDTSDTLTPLEIAEALITGEELEYTYNGTLWMKVEQEPDEVFFYNDGVYKYRRKPKTIVINGVEVPAPLKTLAGRKSAFYIDLFRKVLVETLMPYDIKEELMWATKEDAQKVLDAMLIPFNELNELNKGESYE